MVEVVWTIIEENRNVFPNVTTYWIFVYYCHIGAFLMTNYGNEKFKNLNEMTVLGVSYSVFYTESLFVLLLVKFVTNILLSKWFEF